MEVMSDEAAFAGVPSFSDLRLFRGEASEPPQNEAFLFIQPWIEYAQERAGTREEERNKNAPSDFQTGDPMQR